ncbi:GntR family transcriptional regulator [Radiobacillus deserti]|uniref:GntR family transcriptional regulator n=1 Tax=Radiobacillus deserti TaxID=2594883 RepID=A0A516KC39_9BACI|nr:GntR family transcriptional regulator [Radiobacillus deserti]QDP38942.1 GntR family transcriptional regulator [Radiobacillus deserti]
MNLFISNTSEKPIYQQLFDQISAQILKGEIERGYSLPPIRQAAKELGVSVITIKKAWEELERCGLIYTVSGRGCFVGDLSPDDMLQKRNDMIMKQMLIDTSYYKSFGLTLKEVIELIKKVY